MIQKESRSRSIKYPKTDGSDITAVGVGPYSSSLNSITAQSPACYMTLTGDFLPPGYLPCLFKGQKMVVAPLVVLGLDTSVCYRAGLLDYTRPMKGRRGRRKVSTNHTLGATRLQSTSLTSPESSFCLGKRQDSDGCPLPVDRIILSPPLRPL